MENVIKFSINNLNRIAPWSYGQGCPKSLTALVGPSCGSKCLGALRPGSLGLHRPGGPTLPAQTTRNSITSRQELCAHSKSFIKKQVLVYESDTSQSGKSVTKSRYRKFIMQFDQAAVGYAISARKVERTT